MDQHLDNVGGQSMGMASSASGQNNSALPQPQFGAMSAEQAARFYASAQPANMPTVSPAAAPTPTQDASNSANINNNDAPITTVPVVAEDSDLIEKEWVEKAKSIVEKTRKDPFLLSQQLNQLKTEYLQKRYGKNVGSDGQES